MTLSEVAQRAARVVRKAEPYGGLARPVQAAMTWVEQDKWEDLRGPWGIERPSPKLARPTAESPQWLHDLHCNGWALVKGVIPKDKALSYADRAEDWLEGFNLGYKRDDPATWKSKNLPRHRHGGLFDHFSFAPAQFVWDCKSEPTVREIFATIWGTNKLTVSFDGGTLAVPTPEEPDHGKAPWPHSDQSAYRPWPHCIQGLLNLTQTEGGWIKKDLFNWTDEQLQWFRDRGCEMLKPSTDPGDFILWDSRAVHYGAAPLAANKRMAISVRLMTEEQRLRKVEAFKQGYMTSHDPTDFVLKEEQMADWDIRHPYGPSTINKETQQAIGLIPYD
ncbi:hypothetical protein BDW67DRAFT_177894 [Aspergillus spinulosporus]